MADHDELILQHLQHLDEKMELKFRAIGAQMTGVSSNVLTYHSDMLARYDDHEVRLRRTETLVVSPEVIADLEERLRGLEKIKYGFHALWAVLLIVVAWINPFDKKK